MERKARIALMCGFILPLFSFSSPFVIFAWLPYLICGYFYLTKRYQLAFWGALLPVCLDILLLISSGNQQAGVNFGMLLNLHVAPFINLLLLMPLGLIAHDLYERLRQKTRETN